MAVNISSENFQVLIFFSKLSMRRDYAHLKSTDVYRHVSWLSSMHAKAKLEDSIWEDRQVTKNFSKSNANFSLKKILLWALAFSNLPKLVLFF